jgi:hypothetical protein
MRRKLVQSSPAKIRWSMIVQSIASAALASRRVARQSASLGLGSPLGWLCASRMPALEWHAASAMIDRIGNAAPVSSP